MRGGLLGAGLLLVLTSVALFITTVRRPVQAPSAPIPLSTRVLAERVTPAPPAHPAHAVPRLTQAPPKNEHRNVRPVAAAHLRAAPRPRASPVAKLPASPPAARVAQRTTAPAPVATATTEPTTTPEPTPTPQPTVAPTTAPTTAPHRRVRAEAAPTATAPARAQAARTAFPFPIVADETASAGDRDAQAVAATQAELDAAARYVESVIERDEPALTLVRVTARPGPRSTIDAVATFRSGSGESDERFSVARTTQGFAILTRERTRSP